MEGGTELSRADRQRRSERRGGHQCYQLSLLVSHSKEAARQLQHDSTVTFSLVHFQECSNTLHRKGRNAKHGVAQNNSRPDVISVRHAAITLDLQHRPA